MNIYTINCLDEFEKNEKIIAYRHNGMIEKCWKYKINDLIFVKEYDNVKEFLNDNSYENIEDYKSDIFNYLSNEEKNIVNNFFEEKTHKIFVLDIEYSNNFESYLYDANSDIKDLLKEGLNFFFNDYKSFKWSA